MSEMCPTFVMGPGEKIVAVGFTEWTERGPGDWELVADSEQIPIPDGAVTERIVFELPIGCFELPWKSVGFHASKLQITQGGGYPMQACRRRTLRDFVTDETELRYVDSMKGTE